MGGGRSTRRQVPAARVHLSDRHGPGGHCIEIEIHFQLALQLGVVAARVLLEGRGLALSGKMKAQQRRCGVAWRGAPRGARPAVQSEQ